MCAQISGAGALRIPVEVVLGFGYLVVPCVVWFRIASAMRRSRTVCLKYVCLVPNRISVSLYPEKVRLFFPVEQRGARPPYMSNFSHA